MALEREIKLRFDTADHARARIVALGATPLRGRRLQEDALLDTPDESLRRQRSVLRVRSDGGRSILTFKGPPVPGAMKLREEHETVAADGVALLTILESLGLHVWFRYQKFREEFASEDVVIAIDETPVGVFVEIEGGEAHIQDTARALGCTPDDYITDSYRMLFLLHRETHGGTGTDMLFPEPAGE
jgi:adenylate cyclase class 2